MARFVLLDHSIKRIGGHNFEYALQVLAAAEKAGYQPVLAVNRRFFEQARVPATWQVLPLYTHTTYEVPKWQTRQQQCDPTGEFQPRSSAISQLAAAPVAAITTNPLLQAWRMISRPIRQWRWQHYARLHEKFRQRFVTETEQLCQVLELNTNDQVLVSTLHETELLALSELFAATPYWARCGWHLQFHFPLFTGHETDYATQLERVLPLQSTLRKIAKIPGQQIRCYCTTDRLVAQYQQLEAMPFEVLTWPTQPSLAAPRPARDPEQPLRIGVPGCIRAEKGTVNLIRLWQGLQTEFNDSKQLQFLLQSHRLGKLPTALRPAAKMFATPQQATHSTAPVTVVKWPLSSEDYQQFVRQTDIGLLLYNAADYYVRLSSILVEQLAAGIPVMVPAGCWLGDQLAEPNWQHVERMTKELPALTTIPAQEWEWQDTSNHSWALPVAQRPRLYRANTVDPLVTLVSTERPQRSAVVAVAERTTHVALNWHWEQPATRGSYLRIECAARNAQGMTIQRWTEITAARFISSGNTTQGQGCLIPLPTGTVVLELTFRCAYQTETIQVRDLSLRCLDAFASATGCPLGAVGLIAADVSMAVPLLREMLRHYDHYRNTAEHHARGWSQHYHADQVVQQLTTARQVTANTGNRWAA